MAKKRIRKGTRFLAQQKLVVGVFALLALGIVVFLSTMLLEDIPSDGFIEGEHYQLIDSPRRIKGEQIEIIEFFSYACVHCYNFDPDLTDWVEQQGDKIKFQRMPLAISGNARMLGRHYYTLASLDLLGDYHMPFFRAIHEQRQTFNSPEQLAGFFPGRVVTAEDYTRAYHAAEVTVEVKAADRMARRLQISAVPTVVVQGKYRVRPSGTIGPKRMLDVVDYLIALESSPALPITELPITEKGEPIHE